MKRNWLLWLPLALGLALMGMFYLGLRNPTDHIIASQVVGRKLPEFFTPAAFPDKAGTSSADFADGKSRLINIFASWCVPCVAEVPVLMQLKSQGIEIAGIAVHDSTTDLSQFLAEHGDPYNSIGLDEAGRAQLAFGGSGVPETFVVNGKGEVVYQHIGAVTEQDIPELTRLMGGGRQ